MAATDSTPPNVVFISLESLRADHVSSNGYERATTPNLDALAGTATRYEQAHSVTSWTLTSHASMFTGMYPTAHQVVRPTDRLADGYRTLAEEFEAAGYQTAAIVSGPYLGEKHGLQQGFQHVDESPISPPGVHEHDDITNGRMEAAIERFLGEVRDPARPLFLFLYFWDPHYQYIPPPPYDTRFVPDGAEPVQSPRFELITRLGKQVSPAQLQTIVATYDGEIACTDAMLGRLFARLKDEGLFDPSWIAVTSDHGEQFFEHDRLGHKYDLHGESLHVPLIVKAPGQTQARIDDRLVSLVDLHPTLLAGCGLELAPGRQGRDLAGEPRAPDEPIYHELIALWNMNNQLTGERWTRSTTWSAVRMGDLKLIRNEDKGGLRLYDVKTDPGEQTPLGPDHRPQREALGARLVEWQKAMQTLARLAGEGAQADLTPEEEERLRALGYAH